MKKTKQQKREEAVIRQKEYDALSTEQKVARAKAARGNSKKQLTKLRCNKNKSKKSKT